MFGRHTSPELNAVKTYARSRDPEAFEVLVQRYNGMVFGTCNRVLGVEEDARDATQETFLKLARNASEIRAHPGAWLHGCAVRTSIDMIRTRAPRRRAEAQRAVAESAATEPESDAHKTWQELKPQFDAALAELPEPDRDLIVTRFLLGRSQAEMAAEAGVSPGTLSRRLERSLDRLRAALRSRGVMIAPGVAIAAALGYAPAAKAAPAGLSGGLMEVGLASIAAPTAAAGGFQMGTLAALSLAGLVAFGGGALMLTGNFGSSMGSSTGSTTGIAIEAAELAGPERPTRDAGPFVMRSFLRNGARNATMTFSGNTMTMVGMPEGPDLATTLVVEILEADSKTKPKHLKALMKSFTSPHKRQNGAELLVGKEFGLKCNWKGDEFEFEIQTDIEGAGNGMKVRGMRTAQGPAAESSLIPLFQGTWDSVDPWELKLTKEDIEIVAPWGPVHRFRVLEWTVDGDVAKVQAIMKGSNMDAGMIGQRVKLLVRKDDAAWTLAYHVLPSKKVNEWPSGFESVKDDHKIVATFDGRAK